MDHQADDLTQAQPGWRWQVGPWLVDDQADEIRAEGRIVKLEPQHMRLLLMLAARAGQVVTTQELLDAVWRDLVVTPNSVYQAVAQLRRQLGDTASEPSFIQTVHRKGYRLLAPVQRLRWAPPTPDGGGPAVSPAFSPATPPVTPPEPSPPGPPGPTSDQAATAPTRPERRRALLGAGAALALAAASLGWWLSRRPSVAPGPGTTARLAVLPFADGGGAAALAQGLALDLIRALGRRDDLDVLAPDSILGLNARTEAGTDPQRAALATRLQVQYLLLGEVGRSASQLRLSLRLYQADPAALVWQRQFESQPAGLSQLPATAAAETAAALGLPALPTPGLAGPSDAYELYVLGQNAWRPKTQEAWEQARRYFQRGIDLDPNFARNYVGLAWTWLGQATEGTGLGLPQAIARATPLFERALALEPEAADALTGQAVLYQFAGEFDTARRLLSRAIQAQPSYSQAHFTLGVVEFDEGWPDRAVSQFERASELNPLYAATTQRLGLARLLGGQADAAARDFRRALTLEPRYPSGVWGLGMHGYAVGDLVQAVDNYRQALALEPRRPYLWHELAWLYLDLQRPDEAATAFGRALELLPDTGWLKVYAAYAWLTTVDAGHRGDPPAVLAQTVQQADAGFEFVEACLLRAMAGLPLDAALLQRNLDLLAARGFVWAPGAWFVFQGWYPRLGLATVQQQLGQHEAAAGSLAAVQQRLDALERQGNRGHMLHFHRARLLTLRGQTDAALAALERAVAAGSRRSWWMRLDPALAPLRAQTRFVQLLADVDARVAGQRQQLGL